LEIKDHKISKFLSNKLFTRLMQTQQQQFYRNLFYQKGM